MIYDIETNVQAWVPTDGDTTIDGKRQRVGGWVNDLAVSSDGEVAIAHGRQVSIAGGGVLATHTTTITSLVWHPDERLVAAGSFGRISWTSADDGSADDVELPWGGAVAALCVAEDSGWVAAGGCGDWGYMWKLDEVLPAMAIPVGTSTGRLVGFSADGSQLTFATPKMTAVFDLETPDPLGQPAGQLLSSVGTPTALCWHPTTDLVVTAVSTGSGQGSNGLLAPRPGAPSCEQGGGRSGSKSDGASGQFAPGFCRIRDGRAFGEPKRWTP